MVFNETAKGDFILPSKACLCHFKTTTANVWELTHKTEVNFID